MNPIVEELKARRGKLVDERIPNAQAKFDWYGEETVYTTLKEEDRVALVELQAELAAIDEVLEAWDARPDHIVDVTDMVEGGGK